MTRFAVSRLVLMPALLASITVCAPVGLAQEPAPKETSAEALVPMPAPAAEQLAKIVESMRSIESRLKDRETGDETQSAQQSVIEQLDKLLNMPPDQSPPPSGSGGGGRSDQNSNPQSGAGQSRGQQQRKSQANPQKAGDPSQMRPKPAGQSGGKERQNADDSEERNGPKRGTATPAAKRERLKVDVWGHLPEKLREQLLSSYGEKMLPQYEDAVKRFYDQLANPPSTRRMR